MNRNYPIAAVAVLAFGASVAAHADDTLYKCIAPNGAVSIQSDPCPSGSKQEWKRDTAVMAAAVSTAQMPAVPPPPPPPGAAGQDAPPPGHERGVPRATVESMAPMPSDEPEPAPAPDDSSNAPSPEDECGHAQAIAGELQRMPWLGLSDDQQQRLMRWVQEQCRP